MASSFFLPERPALLLNGRVYSESTPIKELETLATHLGILGVTNLGSSVLYGKIWTLLEVQGRLKTEKTEKEAKSLQAKVHLTKFGSKTAAAAEQQQPRRIPWPGSSASLRKEEEHEGPTKPVDWGGGRFGTGFSGTGRFGSSSLTDQKTVQNVLAALQRTYGLSRFSQITVRYDPISNISPIAGFPLPHVAGSKVCMGAKYADLLARIADKASVLDFNPLDDKSSTSKNSYEHYKAQVRRDAGLLPLVSHAKFVKISHLTPQERLQQLANTVAGGRDLNKVQQLLKISGTTVLDLNTRFEYVELPKGPEGQSKRINVGGQTLLMLLVTQPDFAVEGMQIFAIADRLLSAGNSIFRHTLDLNEVDNEGKTLLCHLVLKCGQIRDEAGKEYETNMRLPDEQRVDTAVLTRRNQNAFAVVHHLIRRICEDHKEELGLGSERPVSLSVNKDWKGFTPVRLAVDQNCLLCVATLLEHAPDQVDLRIQDNERKETALGQAVLLDNLPMVMLLSRYPNRLHYRNKYGETLFHHIARHGWASAHSRDPEAKAVIVDTWDSAGYKAKWGDLPDPTIFNIIIQLVITHARVKVALSDTKEEEVAPKTLEWISAHLNQKSDHGDTPMMIAVVKLDTKMVEALLKWNANPQITFANTHVSAVTMAQHLLIHNTDAEKMTLKDTSEMLRRAVAKYERQQKTNRLKQSGTGPAVKWDALLLPYMEEKNQRLNDTVSKLLDDALTALAADYKLLGTKTDLKDYYEKTFGPENVRDLLDTKARMDYWTNAQSMYERVGGKEAKQHLTALQLLHQVMGKAQTKGTSVQAAVTSALLATVLTRVTKT